MGQNSKQGKGNFKMNGVIIRAPGISVAVPLQNCTLTNGLFYFSDQQWTNYAGRF
jgi:hypothetical protein